MPGASGCAGVAVRIVRRLRQRAAEHALDLGARHAAGPQQHRRVETSDDGGFDADRDRAAIDDQVDPPGKSLCTCAAVVGETWPDRLADGATTGPPNARRISPRHRVGGNPDRDGIEARGGEIGHRAAGRLRQHQRQRPRPERLAPAGRLGVETGDPPRGVEVADMGDQRIERRPALGLVEPRNRRRIGGIGAEAVDGLGRERDQPAFAQGNAPPRPRRPRLRAKSAVVRPTFTGIYVLNSASCGVRNPRL